jgi:hypothetical protein
MARPRVTPMEKWVGEELQRLGFSKYHAARHRKVVLADPKWNAIGEKHSKKIYLAHRAFMDRYNYGMQSMRMSVNEYRQHLLKWNAKEVKRFDRMRAKYVNAHQKMDEERMRFLERYAKKHLP